MGKGRVLSHFLDSGAFSLRKAGGSVNYREYMDQYAAFLHRFGDRLEYYANVDVIPDPLKTWKNQAYLESLGLRPVPVVHLGTGTEWFRKYLDAGHTFIALGGVVGKTRFCGRWLDRCFSYICGGKRSLARLHGFGIVNHRLLIRYPWWSVDSSAWVKEGGHWGIVFVPYSRRGLFDLGRTPLKVIMARGAVSSPTALSHSKGGSVHYFQLSPAERLLVRNWLEDIEIDLEGESGVMDSLPARLRANILYFERLRLALPPTPRPFRALRSGSLLMSRDRPKPTASFPTEQMRVYYSGVGGLSEVSPASVVTRACVMMSFFDLTRSRKLAENFQFGEIHVPRQS